MRTFVIAEAGSNHDGKFGTALELIREAKLSNATAIKFQLWKAEDITHSRFYDSARPHELPEAWIPDLHLECKRLEIEFMCTPFSAHAVKVLNPFVSRWKIASYDVGKAELIEAIKKTNKPIIISDGRNKAENISREIIGSYILKCISEYPAKADGYLSCFRYGDLHRGISDHTTSLVLPSAAVAMGARIVEKHFKLGPPHSSNDGPDKAHSLTPPQFGTMVDNIIEVEQALYSKEPVIEPREDRREWLLEPLQVKNHPANGSGDTTVMEEYPQA